MNDKISEKAVWDELVPSEDEKTSSASFGQSAQAQMMFCYKCNQVIPANSAFCPWCQTELFVTCPKCGHKYSSQYPACNQCGTDQKLYTLEQKRRKAAKQARKEKKRSEEEERYKILLEIQKRNSIRKERKIEEDIRIRNSKEFIQCHEYITKMLKKRKSALFLKWLYPMGFILSFALLDLLLYIKLPKEVFGIQIHAYSIVDVLSFILCYSFIVCLTIIPVILWSISLSAKFRESWINSYIKKNTIPPESQLLVISVLENMKKVGDASHKKLTKCLPNIIRTSYRKVYIKPEC